MEGEMAFSRTELWPFQSFEGENRRLLRKMLVMGFNCPWTSSVGRLFDAVASLMGLHQKIRYEGQAAMALEFESGHQEARPYPMNWIEKDGFGTLDWGPTLAEILKDLANRRSPQEIASNFHGALVEGVIEAARALGQNTVLLGGGCFQNKRLLEDSVRRLRQEGLRVFWPREVPPNDGGLSLGQAVIAREAFSRPT